MLYTIPKKDLPDEMKGLAGRYVVGATLGGYVGDADELRKRQLIALGWDDDKRGSATQEILDCTDSFRAQWEYGTRKSNKGLDAFVLNKSQA